MNPPMLAVMAKSKAAQIPSARANALAVAPPLRQGEDVGC